MNLRHLLILFICLCTGCASARTDKLFLLQNPDENYQYPKASNDANKVVMLQSNIEKTAFYVDDKLVVTGKRVKIMINDRKEHVIKAVPSGYVAKEEFVQPPYSDGFLLSFTYMIGDKENPRQPQESAARVAVSDVDQPLLLSGTVSKDRYAIVIGIDTYRQQLPPADFASRDAELMVSYLTKNLGFPAENVIALTNERAAKSDLEKYFEKWLKNNTNSNSVVLIYYSGHGAPNPKTGDAYLVPYDGDPSFIEETGYSIKRLYKALGNIQAKQVVVLLDSCFSGAGGKSVIAEGSRPLVMTSAATSSVPKNMLVMTASTDSQISSTFKEQGHGMFTYFLLKGVRTQLQRNPGSSINFRELYNYLKPEVEQTSRKKYNNEQTPQLRCSDQVPSSVYVLD